MVEKWFKKIFSLISNVTFIYALSMLLTKTVNQLKNGSKTRPIHILHKKSTYIWHTYCTYICFTFWRSKFDYFKIWNIILVESLNIQVNLQTEICKYSQIKPTILTNSFWAVITIRVFFYHETFLISYTLKRFDGISFTFFNFSLL